MCGSVSLLTRLMLTYAEKMLNIILILEYERMNPGMVILIILGWALAFRWGYVKGRDEWSGNFDACMRSKTTAIKKGKEKRK